MGSTELEYKAQKYTLPFSIVNFTDDASVNGKQFIDYSVTLNPIWGEICQIAIHNYRDCYRAFAKPPLIQLSFLVGARQQLISISKDHFHLKSQGTLHQANWSEGLRFETIDGKRTRRGDLGFVCALTVKLVHRNAATFNHRFLCFADPHTGIIKFLVGLIRTVRVSNLTLQVVMLFLFKCTQSVPVGPLGVGINVHLHDTIFNSTLDLIVGRTGSTVHDQEDGLVRLRSQLLLGISLVLSKPFGLEGDISWLVDSMDISKGSGDREHVSNFGESVIDGIDLFRTGVKFLGVNCGQVEKLL